MRRTIYLTVITLLTIICVLIGIFGIDFDRQKETPDTVMLNGFESIKVDAAVMELHIRAQGEDYMLSYDCSEKLMPKWSITNGLLSLSNQSAFAGWLGVTNLRCNVTLTVPEGTVLEQIDIQTDVGDLFFEKITAQNCELEADVGDVDLNDCTIDNLTVTADVGDIDIDDSTLATLEVNADTGNFSLQNGTFTNLEAETDVGAIAIDSSRDLSDYELELECELGELSINGEAYPKEYKIRGSAGNIHATAELGDIEITY